MAEINEQLLESKLRPEFSPSQLQIEDISGGCGQSFSLYIVSDKFEGKSLLQRHRMVNKCLQDEVPRIHALQMKTLTTKQAEEN